MLNLIIRAIGLKTCSITTLNIKSRSFVFKGYRLVADNGVCRSKEYVSLSKCFKYYSADSPGACEDGCTASNSCVGYYYGYNYGRGYYYCALLPSSITSSTCPSGFNLESDFQRKCRTVKSSDDIVGSTSYQYGWQCYAKN